MRWYCDVPNCLKSYDRKSRVIRHKINFHKIKAEDANRECTTPDGYPSGENTQNELKSPRKLHKCQYPGCDYRTYIMDQFDGHLARHIRRVRDKRRDSESPSRSPSRPQSPKLKELNNVSWDDSSSNASNTSSIMTEKSKNEEPKITNTKTEEYVYKCCYTLQGCHYVTRSDVRLIDHVLKNHMGLGSSVSR